MCELYQPGETMHNLAMIGEILIGLYFVFMGVYNLKNRTHLMESLKGHTFKIPDQLVMLLVILEIVAGAMLVIRFAPKIGAIYLIAFTAIVTVLLHPFWKEKGREMWRHLLVFTNYVAILGALFLILSIH